MSVSTTSVKSDEETWVGLDAGRLVDLDSDIAWVVSEAGQGNQRTRWDGGDGVGGSVCGCAGGGTSGRGSNGRRGLSCGWCLSGAWAATGTRKALMIPFSRRIRKERKKMPKDTYIG